MSKLSIKRIVFMLVCFTLIFSLTPVPAIASQLPSGAADNVQSPSASEVKNWPVPYIHQLWDTANNFNGSWACGPTAAAMALAYYHKLTPNAISVSWPYTHTSDYGYYVSSSYTAFGSTFNRMQNDASGHAAYGGYGHSTQDGAAWAWRIQDYLSRHGGLANEFRGSLTNNSLNEIKQALDNGYLVILGTRLTSAGHIILVRGYTSDNRLIVNDPYGNKYGASGYGKYDGGNVQYTWQQVNSNGKWMIIVKGVADTDDNRVLTSGQAQSGTISPNNDDDPYTFSGSAGSMVLLTMNKTSGSLDSYLELYGPNGLVTLNDDSNGTLNSQINVTLPTNGSYRVVAHSYNHGSNGGYQLTLTTSAADGDDGRWLSMGGSMHGTLTPNSDRDTYYINGAANTAVSIRMNRDSAPLDGYLELYNPDGVKVAENDDGGGDYNPWLVYRFVTGGTYRLVARSYNAASGGGYTLTSSQVRGTNYALNKSVTISSLENSSFSASYATDGNRSTRWSSGSNLDQWLFVDLGQTTAVGQAVIRWEIARATGYGVYYWNGSSWVFLRSVQNGSGDVDVIGFNTVNTRYVLLQMWERDARWGNYSLWELEIYDALGALVPTVPPSDPKDAETDVTPLIPLPPYPDEKDAPILALPSEQEIEPLPASEPSFAPTVSLSETYGGPTATVNLSSLVIQAGGTITATAVGAHDTDSAQVGDGITGYRWGFVSMEAGESGSVADELSEQSSVVIFASDWKPGTYILSLEVQDDEGNWSEPITTTLEIQYGIYLPLILR